MNSAIVSTAIRDAISPAAWPPIPSPTRNRRASSSTRKASSLCCRWRPTCVSPKALTSIRSALLEKGIQQSLSPLFRFPSGLTQIGESRQNLHVLAIPLQRLLVIPYGLGGKAGAPAEIAGFLEE